MRISEVMTEGVVTAATRDSLRRVGELMRDRNVGSVVVCEGGDCCQPAEAGLPLELLLIAHLGSGASSFPRATRGG